MRLGARTAAAAAAAVTAALVVWLLFASGGGRTEGRTLRALAETGTVAASPGSAGSGSAGSGSAGSGSAGSGSAGPGPAASPSRPPVAVRDATLPRVAPTDPVEVPVRLTVGALGARMPVRGTGLDDRGFMALPENPAVAGWYRFGPAPGSGAGAVVLAAHVDSRRLGRGPLARLERLDQGDLVEVVTTTRVHRYRVVSVERLDKSQVDLDDLFSRTGPARLHLVTCGGAFDASARRYEDNVVAVAIEVT